MVKHAMQAYSKAEISTREAYKDGRTGKLFTCHQMAQSTLNITIAVYILNSKSIFWVSHGCMYFK